MKKIITLILISIMFLVQSCQEHTYKITYKVYYPNNVKQYTVVSSGSLKPEIDSYRGTNKITGAQGVILSTTAPIELISVETLK